MDHCSNTSVLDRLEEDWAQLLRSGCVDRALAEWRRDEPALAFDSVQALVDHLRDTTVPTECHDQVLAALLRAGTRDALAFRLILQRFTPCLKQLAARWTPLPHEEWLGLLVATAFEVIRTYPLTARPSGIAGNIALDFRKRAYRAVSSDRRAQDGLRSVDGVDAFTHLRRLPADDAAADLDRVDLADAIRCGIRRSRLNAGAVESLVLTHVAGFTVARLADHRREPVSTVRQRRWRAQRRLATALTGVL